MTLPISKINLNLDTNKPNVKIEERFLQGNTDKTLYLKLLKNNEIVDITDGIKATITLIFYNGANVYKKYKISPKNADGSNNANYAIPAITNSEIEIPFSSDIAFVDHEGRTDLIIYIEDGNNYYTYSCTYYVDKNEAYNSAGIIDNLPTIDGIRKDMNAINGEFATIKSNIASNTAEVNKIPSIQTDISNLKTNVNSNTQAVGNIPSIQSDVNTLKTSDTKNKADILKNTNDIATNKATLDTKAAKDLSNIPSFANAPDGFLLYKKNNQLMHTPIIINDAEKLIDSPYSLKVPANTIELGDNIEIHENGGFIENSTKTLGKNYLLLDYENDPLTGSVKPIYYERASKRTKVDIQPVDTQEMNNVTTVNLGRSIQDKQVQSIYFKLKDTVTNLRFKLNVNGNDVAYYPNKNAYDGNETGINLVAGLQKIDLKPFWTTLTEYTTVITFKSDTPLNLLGNGTIPYIAQDLNSITRKDIALMDDVNNIDNTGLAKKDLSNVLDSDFFKKGSNSGLLQQDLEDIDLPKLLDKGHDAGLISGIMASQNHGDYRQGEVKEITFHNNLDLTFDNPNKTVALSINSNAFANKDLSNVIPTDLDKSIRLTNAYKEIVSKKPEHNGVIARHIEEQGPIDFSTINEKLIHAVYQITAEQEIITQVLPPLSDDKTIIIEILLSSGINNFSHITLKPNTSEMINGSTNPLILNEKGIQGVLIPEASNSWIWVPYPMMHEYGIGVNDQRSNFFLGQQSLAFGAGFTATQDPTDNTKVKIDYTESGNGGNGLMFSDVDGNNFTPKIVGSQFKDIEIHKINNSDGTFNANLNINPEVLREKHNEGILAFLGNDQIINSKFGKSKLYFGDTRVKGGTFVYEDLNTKSFVIQDIDPQDDPNVSGGSTFIIALYYEPDKTTLGPLTQSGSIELLLVDSNDNPIEDTNGNPMGSKIDYESGEIIKPELYIGECKAKAYTEVHMKIKLNFTNEEIVTVGANSCLMIQSISKDESSGLALMAFMAFTGYRIQFDTRYYGYNSMNLARSLVFDQAETSFAGNMEIGPNLFLDAQNNVKISISNYNLNISDDGKVLPIWSLTKVYDKLDSKFMEGKNYKVTVTLIDKDDAYRVSMLKYTGTTYPIPRPKVETYNNSNPVFTNGWIQVDELFISEDVVSGEHKVSKNFIIPQSDSVAFCMHAVSSQLPMNVKIKDLEGDITPWFNKIIITDNSHIKEQYLIEHDYIYRTLVQTPSGISAYRYTVTNTDTKIPIGVISGGDNKIINDNSWTDAGSSDPLKVQGDLKFLADGKVKMSYNARIYNETITLNQVEFWLAKVNGDGTFTEVPNSRYATTIESNRNTPKKITSNGFNFNVLANETYRMFAKSDKTDGFYLQSETNGEPLFRIDIDFDEITSEEKDIIDKTNEIRFMEAGKEVFSKILEYDVTTGKMKVIDK